MLGRPNATRSPVQGTDTNKRGREEHLEIADNIAYSLIDKSLSNHVKISNRSEHYYVFKVFVLSGRLGPIKRL